MSCIELLPASQLGDEIIRRWQDLRRFRPEFASPLLSPQMIRYAAQVRPGIELILVRQAGQIGAIIPFRRSGGSVASPVLDTFSDPEAWIAEPGVNINMVDILRQARLRSWRYRCWLADQRPLTDCAANQYPSHVIDISQGWQAYCQERRAAGTDIVQRMERSRRKLAKDCGEPYLVLERWPSPTLRSLLEWKDAWVRQKGLYNPIGAPWHMPLFELLLQQCPPSLSAFVSALCVKGEAIAGMFIVQEGDTGTCWLSGFNLSFARYSPGLVWHLEFLQQADRHGIRRLEMGHGNQPDKVRLGNMTFHVAEGEVSVFPAVSALRRRMVVAKRWFRESAATRPAYVLLQRTRQAWRKSSCSRREASRARALTSPSRPKAPLDVALPEPTVLDAPLLTSPSQLPAPLNVSFSEPTLLAPW